MFIHLLKRSSFSSKSSIPKLIQKSTPLYLKSPIQCILSTLGKRYYDIVNTDHLKNEGIQLKSPSVGLSNNLSTNKPFKQISDNVQHIAPLINQEDQEINPKDLNKEQILFKLFKTSTSVTQFYDLITILLEKNKRLQTYEINEILKHMVNRGLWRLALYIYDRYHDTNEFNETSYIYILKALNDGGYSSKVRDIWTEINNRFSTKSEPLLCSYLECVFHYNDLQSALYIYSLLDMKKKYISPHIGASILKGICDGKRYYECIYMFEKMELEGATLNEVAYTSYIHSLFQICQYEKCIAIYNDMKSKGITPSIGIYTDMITIYDKTNVHANVYEEALKMARDVHVNLNTSLKARLLRYISDEQKEQGLWLLREMINVTKYNIPEVHKNGNIYIDYTTIPSSISRFSLLSIFNKLKKKYNNTPSNNKQYTITYPSLYITTSNEIQQLNGILRLLKEDMKPSISYSETNGVIVIQNKEIQRWIESLNR